jgi:hypothetical protein
MRRRLAYPEATDMPSQSYRGGLASNLLFSGPLSFDLAIGSGFVRSLNLPISDNPCQYLLAVCVS